MAKGRLLRTADLERLRVNIKTNAAKYSSAKSWIGEYIGGNEWSLPASVEIPEGLTLHEPTDESSLLDLENTRVLYTALHHLTPTQAADERFWTYLTHVTFWPYMRARWGVEKYRDNPRFAEVVQERYFFMPDRPRAVIRNGIARLWWYGYTTFDPARADPFELTGVLLKNLDVAQSVLERAFSRNRPVAHAVLSVLRRLEEQGTPFYERLKVRELAKFLVQLGGVTIIDALGGPAIEAIVLAKAGELAPAKAQVVGGPER